MTNKDYETDNSMFECSDEAEFQSFIEEREHASEWKEATIRELKVEATSAFSPKGVISEESRREALFLVKHPHFGILYMRNIAASSLLERARISGYALSRVSKEVFAEIINYCMGVATGDSLIRIADSKVSAVHGGDPKDYAVMEMLPLFEHVCDYVNQEFPGNHFVTAHFDHMMATAIWRLDGQADKLLDTYRREVAAKGLNPDGIVPALRFTTSDVGMSGANLYPIFLNGNGDRIIPLGYPIKTDHRNGVDLDYFDKQLALLYARYCASIDAQIKLLDIEIQYPATTMLGVLKKIGAPKKSSYEAQEYFLAIHGDSPCTAYELYMQMSDVIFSAQCEGAAGIRIAQLEEIIARALHINWSDYDRPGTFKW